MNENILKSVELYQCPGCIHGHNTSCFIRNSIGVGCGKHSAGTYMFRGVGHIFLGLPKGFNRLGSFVDFKPLIFETYSDRDVRYDMWNTPVWKYKNEYGHTLVRGFSPRKNEPFLHIFLEDCLDEIDCFEITQEHVDYMD